ncbi:MAG: hypothetical protein U0840_03100 [Gemmataceae bacterium]
MMPLLLALLLARADFTEVKLDRRFAAYLQASPLLMETAGAKIIRLKDGRHVLLGVGSVALEDDRPKTRIDAEKICRAKALAAIVSEREGVQVAHEEKVNEKTVIVLDDGKEKAKSVTELLSVTRTRVKGYLRGMQLAGRWRSDDGKVLYLAVGTIIDKAGEPVPLDD